MQVEGYSLEAQKERLRKYADFQEMVIDVYKRQMQYGGTDHAEL